MHLISWNVNGIRAAIGKGLGEFVQQEQPDVLCLQETKAMQHQVTLPDSMKDYHGYWNSAEKAGYSGVALFSREEPQRVWSGMELSDHDREGRVICAEFETFILVNVYTPNAQDGLRRLPYRMEWDAAFRLFLVKLGKSKPVVFCGDLNVAHHEIDLARPRENRLNPGFSDGERDGFSKLLDSGFVDTYRALHPQQTGAYSWWSYRAGARQNNVGWRIDYFGVARELESKLKHASIMPHVLGSDHCPVSITLETP
ncbi:MAG: exodeoxyribonuclease III [Verrucomicrobia bacterium]|nr:MAG: exodeoxyribonuclease III [Verrucomicrobiota bacterium]